MKKKLLSLALALALCLGLSVPAMADEAELDEKTKQVLETISLETSAPSTGKETYKALTRDPMVQSLIESEITAGFYPEGTTFTATNISSPYQVYITFECFEKQPPNTKIEYEEDSGSAEGSRQTMDVSGRYIPKYDEMFLVTPSMEHDGVSIAAENGRSWVGPNAFDFEDLVLLKPGESLTFQVPETGANLIYAVRIIVYDETEDQRWYKFVNAIIDDELANSAKADTPAPASVPADAPAATGFTDVGSNSPFKAAIDWAVEQNITKGITETTFGPSNTCTHNHILTFLWRANGSPEAEGENDFAKAAAWAESKGLISGDSFDGSAPCTRSQTVTYLWKLAESPETEVNDTFTDVPADADYVQAVAWAVAEGITKGTTETTFGPDVTCTRGQIVTFLYRDLGE